MPEARFVLSEKGDSLSPKSAPQITAPAIIPGGKPMAMPMPIIASPPDPADP